MLLLILVQQHHERQHGVFSSVLREQRRRRPPWNQLLWNDFRTESGDEKYSTDQCMERVVRQCKEIFRLHVSFWA